MRHNIALVGLVGVFAIAACNSGSETPSAPTKKAPAAAATTAPTLSLQLPERHPVETAGYLAADPTHLTAEGVKLSVRAAKSGVDPVLAVTSGQADFGVADAATLIRAKADGRDVVAILAPFQGSLDCIAVNAASGPAAISDVKNVKLEIANGNPMAYVLAKKLKLEGVTVVPPTTGADRFKAPATAWYQRHSMLNPKPAKGEVALKCLSLDDAGYAPYSSVMFTSRTVLNQKRDAVAKVVRAASVGWWDYANRPVPVHMKVSAKNPDIKAKDLSLRWNNVRGKILPTGGRGVGTMDKASWTKILTTLEDSTFVPKGAVKVDELFDSSMVPKVAPKPRVIPTRKKVVPKTKPADAKPGDAAKPDATKQPADAAKPSKK